MRQCIGQARSNIAVRWAWHCTKGTGAQSAFVHRLRSFRNPATPIPFDCGRHLLRAALLCLALALVPSVHAAEVPESSVKAAFLYKFLSYIEWPPETFASPSQPIEIGVLQDGPVASALEEIAAHSSFTTRPVHVRPLRFNSSLDGLHVLFIGSAARKRLPYFVSQAEKRGIMTVTETNGATVSSVIDFLIIDDRVRFNASLSAAKRAGVQISSRLLSVAETVHGAEP